MDKCISECGTRRGREPVPTTKKLLYRPFEEKYKMLFENLNKIRVFRFNLNKKHMK